MGDAATPTLPNFTSQTASVYKANIDAGFAVADRLAWAFAPHQQDQGSPAPNMTLRLDAGAIFDGATLTEVAEQGTAVIAAPSADPRIDRVVIDETTGTVSVITGTEAASPTPPTIPAGKIPIAQVSLTVGMTEITDSDITDERQLGLLGLGNAAKKNVDLAIKSANYTVTSSDNGKLIGADASGGNITITLPPLNDVSSDFSVDVIRLDDLSGSPVGTVSVVPDGGSPTELINGSSNRSLGAQYTVENYAAGNAQWLIRSGGHTTGGLQSVQVFTADGTWTKPGGIKLVRVQVVGGGGGGGVGVTGQGAAGAGGGGYSEKLIEVSAIASETVTVGTGGASATAGGTSSFGAQASATGGTAGGGPTANDGGAGGLGASGDINVGGSGGGIGSTSRFHGGSGGSSALGGGGAANANDSVGNPGRSFGGGGSGGAGNISLGGAGAVGVVIVWEYS